ncbi:hypothetical protein ACS0PU_010434 [Formica fusca]
MDENQAFGIADLTTTEYHQLLYNDKAAWKFVQSIPHSACNISDTLLQYSI